MTQLRESLGYGDGLRALVYLDAHTFLNRLRTIRRDPLRLVVWGFFVIWLLLFLPLRFQFAGAPSSPDSSFWLGFFHHAAPFAAGGALLLLAVAVAASRRALGLFRSAADARYLCGSSIPHRLVVLWLAFRLLRMALVQLPFIAVWLVILPTSVELTWVRLVAIAVTLLLMSALWLGLNLPLFALRQQRVPVGLGPVAVALALLGIVSLLVAFNGVATSPVYVPAGLSAFLTSLPPGSWLVGGFAGDPLAIFALAACGAVAIGLTVLMADDVYPELWQASTRMLALRRLARRRGMILDVREAREALRDAGAPPDKRLQRRAVAPSSPGTRVPTGALTLLWKEWLAVSRSRGGLQWPMILILVALVFGWTDGGGFGRPARGLVFALNGLVAYIILIYSVVAAVRLAVDLRNPLWWLSAASLRARLVVLSIARSLRLLVPISAGLLAAALAARSVLPIVLGVPLVAASLWDLQALGFATYAVIPGSADMRGPGQVLRFFALAVMVFPVVIVLVVVAVLTHSAGLGLFSAALSAALEGWGLIAFAALRLQGNGLAFARGERR